MPDITYIKDGATKTLPDTFPAEALLADGWEVKGDGKQPVVEKPLNKMNKDELISKAAEVGAEVAEGATNAQIIEAIVKKTAEAA